MRFDLAPVALGLAPQRHPQIPINGSNRRTLSATTTPHCIASARTYSDTSPCREDPSSQRAMLIPTPTTQPAYRASHFPQPFAPCTPPLCTHRRRGHLYPYVALLLHRTKAPSAASHHRRPLQRLLLLLLLRTRPRTTAALVSNDSVTTHTPTCCVPDTDQYPDGTACRLPAGCCLPRVLCLLVEV